MKTYFASPERADVQELQGDLDLISHNPVIAGLLNAVSGLFAVLNEHRQVLTVNLSYLDLLGISDAREIIGLRPGETLNCIHAHKEAGGCGTSQYCPTCGAAIAIAVSQKKDVPVEQLCAIAVERNGRKDDLFLRVKSLPIRFENRRVLLLFLQNVTQQQRLLGLESVFFHDISNMVFGLVNSSQLLRSDKPDKREAAADRIQIISRRLARELQIQRVLLQSDELKFQLDLHKFRISQLHAELQSMFHNHPAIRGKSLTFSLPHEDICLTTDMSLLLRIISNMIINALEASVEGDEIEVRFGRQKHCTRISVWNRAVIPEDIARRIFQRNFSTKGAEGRGLGTYSMKLLGEEFLKGTVGFSSAPGAGTEFWIDL